MGCGITTYFNYTNHVCVCAWPECDGDSGGFYDDEIGLRVEDEDYSSAYGKLVIW